MQFGSPLALVLLVFLPVFSERVVTLIEKRLRTRHSAPPADTILFSSTVNLDTLPVSPRIRFRALTLSTLGCASFLCLVIALARPQTATSFTEEEASGRDILLVLDLSGSMQALDFELEGQRVNRLTALQSVVTNFISTRRGDRMGLVVFADQVYTQCPLTLDHAMLNEFVKALKIGMAGQGTAIGDAIGIGLKRIKDIPGESKVLVLVTDGKSNTGSLTPKEGAALAKSLAVKIHTIGIGSSAPAPFPVKLPFGGTQLVYREMEYDAATLKLIASETGGQYFNARDTEALQSVYEEIDRLELRKQKEQRFVRYEEHFFIPLLMGLGVFVIGCVLEFTLFLTVP